MSRILIVEDEEAIAELEKDYLELNDFEVKIENSGDTGLAAALAEDFDLIILDLMLPGIDGFEICRRLRENKDVPILMVSAKKDDIDKIRGLGLGADDYITKPFLPEELLLRVKAVLKRTYNLEDETGSDRIGKALVDWGAGTICVDGEDYMLTAKEFMLLKKLCENRGRILSMNVLCDTLWPDGSYGYENSLMVHIRHLREKLEDNPSRPEHLLTVRGLGYKLK